MGRCCRWGLTRQIERLQTGLQAGDPDYEVTVAWRCYQRFRSAYHAKNLNQGRRSRAGSSTPSTPARSPRSPAWAALRAWRTQFLAYFTTSRANNGGTEAIGIIELQRRIAHSFRNLDNYRLRMILAAGRLTHPDLR